MTSTTGGDFKAIELTWSEGFGGLCKLEGSKAERSMIGSCSNNDRFLVGQKGNSNSNDLSVSVMNARKKRTTDPQDIGVDDMRLYVKFSVTNCGVYTAEKDNNFPFKFDYSTFFFEGEEHSMYENVSDVVESRVWFASKNLTPRRMHINGFLIAKIDRRKKSGELVCAQF